MTTPDDPSNRPLRPSGQEPFSAPDQPAQSAQPTPSQPISPGQPAQSGQPTPPGQLGQDGTPAWPDQPYSVPSDIASAPKKTWSTGKTIGVVIGIVLACVLVLGAGGCVLFSLIADPTPTENALPATDPVSGNNWRANDGSYLMLASDGTFLWYQDENDRTDSYYNGTYQVFMGEDAIKHVTEDLSDYGVTRKELEEVFARSDSWMNADTFCCVVLTNNELVIDGKNTLEAPKVTPCYGFYNEDAEYLDIANMDTATYWGFTKA